jgi:hypothetical protein
MSGVITLNVELELGRGNARLGQVRSPLLKLIS